MRTLLTPLISKDELSFSYGHLRESISNILEELAPKRDKQGNRLKFQWTFTSSEFKEAFGKAQTKTAPGYSGMTKRLWKAIADDDDLTTIYSKLIELPFRYGFTYPRWENSILAMLQKKDLLYLNKLRIIELFELDLNAFLKLIMGRTYPKYEKTHDMQHPESYGAVKGKSAHEALMSVQLAMEQSRLSNAPMTIAPKDATKCFDLIRPELTQLIQNSKGVPPEMTSTKTNIQ